MSVLESAEFIANHSKDVFINSEGVDATAKYLVKACQEKPYTTGVWKTHDLHPKTNSLDTLHWIVVIDTLNFSFWSATDTLFTVNFNGKKYTGYWSLCAAINRALAEGIPITKPEYFATVTREELEHIFRSETSEKVPLLDQRLENLHQVGQTLVAEYDSSFANVISQCDTNALRLLEIVTERFKCFNDKAVFENRTVYLQKRVQILIADIWACFGGTSYGQFGESINAITMFADYRVPQMLVFTGAMKYSDELWRTLKDKELMTPGDRREVEIRGCSIWAVECIRRRIAELEPNQPMNAILIDFFLWDAAKAQAGDQSLDDVPIHRVRSIFY